MLILILNSSLKIIVCSFFQIDSKMIRKIATGDVKSSDAHLLKEWCKKELVPVNVTVNATDSLNATEQPQVTEMVSVGVEKCKHFILSSTFFLNYKGFLLLLLFCFFLSKLEIMHQNMYKHQFSIGDNFQECLFVFFFITLVIPYLQIV